MSHLPPGYLVLPEWSRGSSRAMLLGRRAPGIDSGRAWRAFLINYLCFGPSFVVALLRSIL
jgi:hypothetical protein